MTERGLGWVLDEHDPRDVRAELGTGTAPPWSAACSSVMPPVMDQGADQSCVAQSVAALVWAAHRRAAPDLPPELLSRKALWWLCRAQLDVQGFNLGTQLRTAFRVLNSVGFCRERWHPHAKRYDESVRPAAARMSDDQRQRDLGTVAYRSLVGMTEGVLLDAVKHAIAARLPVVAGWMVSRDFVAGRIDPTDPIGPPAIGEIKGGHAMVLHAYEGDDFLVRSSWGDDWGESGSAWLRGDYVAQGQDFWTVLAAPPFSDRP